MAAAPFSRYGRASALTMVLALILMTVAATAAMPPVRAALSPAGIVIDGNATGTDDWTDPPAALLDFADINDPCGSVVDPTVLQGKLDDLVLDSPDPQPGKPNATADLCQAWYALDSSPQPDGSYHTVLYGA